jgi:PAS domain S-box-containing protein
MKKYWSKKDGSLPEHWSTSVTLLVVLASLIGFFFIYQYVEAQILRRNRAAVSSVLETRQDFLTEKIHNQIELMDRVRNWLETSRTLDGTLKDSLQTMMNNSLVPNKADMNIGLNFSNGITYSYGNGNVLALLRQYWNIPAESMYLVSYGIKGPFVQADGRMMLYLYMPFKTDDTTGYIDSYLDISQIIQPIQMDLGDQTLIFAVKNNLNDSISGDQKVYESDPQIQKYTNFNTNWEIAVAPQNGWKESSVGFLRQVGLVVLILICIADLIFYFFLRRQVNLIRTVQKANQDLNAEFTRRVIAQEKLTQSENFLSQASRYSRIGIWEYDLRLQAIHWSDELYQLLGISRSDFTPDIKTAGQLLSEPVFEICLEYGRETIKTKRPLSFEHSFDTQKGNSLTLRVVMNPRMDEAGEVVSIWGLVIDISLQRSVEEQLLRVNRSLQMVVMCDQELARASNEQELLDNLCKLIIDKGGYQLVWVGEALNDAEKNVHVLAEWGNMERYLNRIHLRWDDSPEGNGPTGRAIKTGTPVVTKDIEKDPNIVWKKEALESAFRSALSIPLIINSGQRGVFCIYSDHKDAFSSEEVDLLTQLAADLAIGISSLRARNEYQAAVEQMRISEAKFSKAFHLSPDAVTLSDFETGHYLEVNEGFVSMTGYSREEALGKSARDLNLWSRLDDRGAYYEEMRSKLEVINHRFDFVTKAGAVRVGMLSARVIDLGERKVILGILRDMTESIRNENALRVSQEQNRLITDSMSETVWLVDENQTISYVSSSVLNNLGYTPEEVQGKPVSQFLLPASNMIFEDALHMGTIIQSDHEDNREFPMLNLTFIHKDKSERNNEVTLANFVEAGRDNRTWICVARDITERTEMQAALQTSEERWQYALEGSGDGVWDWDLQKDRLYFSPRFKTMLGYQSDEVWGSIDDWRSKIHPEDQADTLQAFNDCLNGVTEDFQTEYRMLRADGSYQWTLDRGKVIEHRPDGQASRIVGTITDMTEHRQIIQALEQSEQQFRLLAERSTDMISRHSLDGKFIYSSPASQVILGYEENELVNTRIFDLVHPEDKTLVNFVLERLDVYKEIHPLQFRIRQKSGTFIWVETTASVIHDPVTGKILEVQATTRDISARVSAENALRESEEKLRSLISQSADGIVLVNEEGKVIEWSKGQERLTGKPAVSSMDRPVWDVMTECYPPDLQTPANRARNRTRTEEFLRSGSYGANNITYEEILERKDGSRLVVQTTTFPIHTPHGYMAGSISRDITSIRNAEKALKQSEERLRFITDHMIDMICHINADGKLEYISPSVQSTLGYKPADLIGIEYTSLVHPSDQKVFNDLFSQHPPQGQLAIQGEYRIRNASGDYQWIESVVSLVTDDNGDFAGAILGSRDTSEKKLSNDALRESESRYRILTHNFPNGMVMLFDPDFRFTVVDGMGMAQFGLTRETAEGRQLHEIFSPEQAASLEPYMRSALDGSSEMAELHLDDTVIQLYVVPIYDESTSITGGMMMTQDITDRKNAVEALSNRAQFLSVLNEITRIALETSTTTDLVQQIADLLELMFEADTCYITGWDAANQATIPLAATGRMKEIYPKVIYPPGETTLTKSVIEIGRAIAVENVMSSPYVTLSVASRYSTQSALVLPLIGGGQPLGAALIGYDNPHLFEEDEMLQAEQVAAQIALGLYKQKLMDEVRIYNQELEQRVMERTADLEAKNKELETFTYSVSHDLKAPLRGIDGYSKLLLEDHAEQLDEEGMSFLQTIRQATLQMNRLIEDLLSYSRLERRAFNNDKVNLLSLVNHILLERQNDLATRGIAVHKDVADIWVNLDEKAMEQALRNLVDNAIKFTTDQSNPSIEIGLKSDTGKYILFVKDNGIGFDMKYHEKIFDIFQRLHLAEDYPGTGIGLALVKKAMQRLGGRAWAESAPGSGSTFYLEFPGELL